MAEILVRTVMESTPVLRATFELPVSQSTTFDAFELVPFVLPVLMEYPPMDPIPREDDGAVVQLGGTLRVVNNKPSDKDFVPPVDDNPLSEEEYMKVSDIILDITLSHDSYLKFSPQSDDGFRAVLDADGRIVTSSYGGYEVEAPRFGSRAQRTVITNSDFKLTINLSPTIVKAF